MDNHFSRVLGALRSKNKAAYLAIIIKLVKPFARSIDYVYSIFGKRETRNDTISNCLLIISPPRSGSTIIYQMLVNTIPCVYISNLHALFPSLATNIILKKNRHKLEQSNYYGYSPGLFGVYEGNEFLESLLDKSEDDPAKIRKRFINFAKKIKANHTLPFIFKNVAAYKDVIKLSQAVPELNYLFLTRNREQTIQSSLKAFYEIGNYNPVPDSIKCFDKMSPVEKAVNQILEIEKIIDSQKKIIPDDQKLDICYEEFCESPWVMIDKIANHFFKLSSDELNQRLKSIRLSISNCAKVGENDKEQIKIILEKYSAHDKPN